MVSEPVNPLAYLPRVDNKFVHNKESESIYTLLVETCHVLRTKRKKLVT